jgi:hypothetical protein
MKTKELEKFVLKADVLTQEHNGMTLGEIYMRVLKDDYPILYDEIKGTHLDVSVCREHIPLFFSHISSKLCQES